MTINDNSIEIDERNLSIKDSLEYGKKILEVKDLKTYFYTEEGIVKAVDGVSFDIYKDEFLGLVGETGCGKSVTALSILRLVRAPGKTIAGKIIFNNKNLIELPDKEMRQYRGNQITMIFQDPLNSLNPVISIGKQLGEVFLLHQEEKMKRILKQRQSERDKLIIEKKRIKEKLKVNKELLSEEEKKILNQQIKDLNKQTAHNPVIKDVIFEKAEQIVKDVGIADAKGILTRYPHELSGGMRQRIMIAMALICNPLLLIADEPTTALDVTIQAQILELIKRLKKKYNTSILLITHNLGIIAETCDRVAVMYSGNIVEYATAEELFHNPRHPYTKGLINAIPRVEKIGKKLKTIRGMVPNLIYPPTGCRFHPRCEERLEVCDKIRPKFIEINDRYYVACHLFDPEHKNSKKYQRKEKEDIVSKKV